MRVLGLKPERIEVIYPGVAESFFGAAPVSRGKPYILFVGTIEPRKNLNVLLDAYEGSRPPCGRSSTWWWRARRDGEMRAALDRLRSGMAGVRYLGYAAERDLPGAELGAKGVRRAEQYRWEVCARKSWQFFERVR